MSHASQKLALTFAALIFLAAGVSEAADVNVTRHADEMVISAAVQSDFAGSEASISAPDNSTIEVAIAGADFSVDGKRQLFRFEDAAIKTVSVSRDKSNGVVRFNVKDKNAGLVADQIRITRAEDRLILTMPVAVDSSAQVIAGAKVVAIAAAAAKTDAAPGVVTESAIKAASLTAGAGEPKSEDKAAAGKTADKSDETTAVLKDKRPESEIPVFSDKSEAKKAGSSSLERLVMTLFVVCALLGAALFGLKRWAARRGKNVVSPTKINILTQHHLGPKKSLAIIQVAGEAILIGITDQNISMLKTLALIDDEVPGHVPKNFADELDNDDSEARQLAEEGYEAEDLETDNFALRGLSDVRDLVSTRFGSKPAPKISGKVSAKNSRRTTGRDA